MVLLKSNTLRQLLIKEHRNFLDPCELKVYGSSDNYKQEQENSYELFQVILLAIEFEDFNINKATKDIADKIYNHYKQNNISLEVAYSNIINFKEKVISLLENYDTIPNLTKIIIKTGSIFDKIIFEIINNFTYKQADNTIMEDSDKFAKVHNDRLLRLGKMTSSFVHEFKNPLTTIQGFVQLLQNEHPDMKYLNIIESEIKQLNYQLTQFLLLSRKDCRNEEKQSFPLLQLIEDTIAFLYPNFLEKKIKVSTFFNCEEHLEVFGYQKQLRQVFINIIFNAIDVLARLDADRELIIAVNNEIDGQIQITITNNGPTISQQLIETIFNPFVTTKKQGTGLGLSICKQIH